MAIVGHPPPGVSTPDSCASSDSRPANVGRSEHPAVRGAHLRARVKPELVGEPPPDGLVVRQRRRLLPGRGQHEHQACLQRFVQWLAGRDLPQQRKYSQRLAAGQGDVGPFGDGSDVLLVDRREVIPVSAVKIQALAAPSAAQGQCFQEEIESVRRTAGDAGILHRGAEGEEVRHILIGGEPVRDTIPGQPAPARSGLEAGLEKMPDEANVLMDDIYRTGRRVLLP